MRRRGGGYESSVDAERLTPPPLGPRLPNPGTQDERGYAPDRAPQRTRRQLRAEVKRLEDSNARMMVALGRKDAQLLVAKCERHEADLALAGLQIELRYARTLGAVLPAELRAMPEPVASVAPLPQGETARGPGVPAQSPGPHS